MKQLRLFTLAVLLPALGAFLATGCGGDTGKDTKSTGSRAGGGSDDTGKGGSGGSLQAVEAKGVGTLKGKVVFDGNPPAKADIKGTIQSSTVTATDKEHCLKGDTDDPKWTVGAGGGVADVVVWVRAPEGKYLKVPEDQRKPEKDIVTVDQPFCAFKPHVSVVFPSYYDAAKGKQVKTGQKFIVKNSAPIAHNTKSEGKKLVNDGRNETINKGQQLELAIRAGQDAKAGPAAEDRVELQCDIHKWMRGHVWAFDHPYATVTKEDGTFEIKNVPAGAEVYITHWHETFDKPKTEKITVKEGDNTLPDIKVK